MDKILAIIKVELLQLYLKFSSKKWSTPSDCLVTDSVPYLIFAGYPMLYEGLHESTSGPTKIWKWGLTAGTT